jgi:hypothetical protein
MVVDRHALSFHKAVRKSLSVLPVVAINDFTRLFEIGVSMLTATVKRQISINRFHPLSKGNLRGLVAV